MSNYNGQLNKEFGTILFTAKTQAVLWKSHCGAWIFTESNNQHQIKMIIALTHPTYRMDIVLPVKNCILLILSTNILTAFFETCAKIYMSSHMAKGLNVPWAMEIFLGTVANP
jgi:hypothetical protein